MDKKKFFKNGTIILTILGLMLIFFGAQNGYTLSKYYYLYILASLPIFYLAIVFNKKGKYYKAKDYVRDHFGIKESYKRSFDKLEQFFKYHGEEGAINRQTFYDLDLDKFFSEVDRTFTTIGAQKLYDILRHPILKKDLLEKRRDKVKYLLKEKELREKISVPLWIASREGKGCDVLSLLQEDIKINKIYYILYNVAFILNLISLTVLVLSINNLIPSYYLASTSLFITATVIFSTYLHKKDLGGSRAYAASASYLCTMLNAAYEIKDIKSKELEEYLYVFKENSALIENLIKKSGTLGRLQGADMAVDYFNILFLSSERSFFKIAQYIIHNRQEILKIYESIGEIDALISIASYESTAPNHIEPDLSESRGGFIKTKAIVHPLIEKPVPNNLDTIEEGIIITGSNMSGKSTFLRTLGINMVISQTLGIVFAEEFHSSLFKICTSINPGDNLFDGKSYYLGEAEAIFNIIKTLDKEVPTLSLIDEIFRGTNPIERVNAAAEIMEYLKKNNSIPIVATHDLQLAKMVHNYKCFYFTEDVEEQGLVFDYHMRQGISPTRNAVKLLAYLGYPKEIVDNTNKRIIDIK